MAEPLADQVRRKINEVGKDLRFRSNTGEQDAVFDRPRFAVAAAGYCRTEPGPLPAKSRVVRLREVELSRSGSEAPAVGKEEV
ncbi:MAG: hypothetical protein Kow00109_13510 [Acidobacteriota bacterium]